MKAVIILPTYNEKENLLHLIPVFEKKIFPNIRNYKMHILVVDDNSPDNTAIAIKKLMKTYPNIYLSLGEKKGLGAAYLRGMSYAVDVIKADILIGMDADGQHDPHDLIEFLNQIDAGFDFVIGSRYIAGGSIPKAWRIHRKFLSIMGNLVINNVFGTRKIHDWTNSYRALRKEVFLKEKLKISKFTDYTFLTSFLYEAIKDKFKVKEIPITFGERISGKSKMATKRYIFELIKFLAKRRIQGFFGKS